MFGGQNDNVNTAQQLSTAGDGMQTNDYQSNDNFAGALDSASSVASDQPTAVPPTTDNADFMPSPSEPPQSSVPAPDEEAEDITSPTPADPTANSSTLPESGSDELLELKKKALEQLSPIVSQLEQTPEEKFRTIMMLIQASDNQALLNEAYAAAQAIPDEKAKAQALLDVVNEINYFTQNKSHEDQA